MGKLNNIRTALAAQLESNTGVDSRAYLPDSITTPMLALKSGDTNYVDYGITTDGVEEYVLDLLVLLSYTPSAEAAQAAMDDLVDGGTQITGGMSILDAVKADPTLGGTVDWIVVNSVSKVGLVEISGQSYFSARVNLSLSTSSF
jgi:hypothetical protein